LFAHTYHVPHYFNKLIHIYTYKYILICMSKDKFNFTLSSSEIQELDRRRGMVSRSTYIGYLIRHAVTPIDTKHGVKTDDAPKR
jgi:hypothetical protein